jgi:hypothetical protein
MGGVRRSRRKGRRRPGARRPGAWTLRARRGPPWPPWPLPTTWAQGSRDRLGRSRGGRLGIGAGRKEFGGGLVESASGDFER